MGKYDIYAKLNDECKLTLADLIQELLDERKDTKKGTLSEGAYRQKFVDKKSGLIPKIKKATGIDLTIYLKGEDKQEKFNALKILKCFYEIEKDGIPKNKGGIGIKSPIKITDILREPKLQNVDSIYTTESVYGEVFEDLYRKIKDNAEYGNYIERNIDETELRWSTLRHRIVCYYRKWECQVDENKAINELNELEIFLEQMKEKYIEIRSVLEGKNDFNDFFEDLSLKRDLSTSRKQKEKEEKYLGVMDRLFVVLKAYKVLCMETDQVLSGQGNIEDVDLPVGYEDRYHQCSHIGITEDEWNDVIKYFDEFPNNKEVDLRTKEIVDLILYGREDLSLEEIKKYRYAVKKVGYLRKIILEDDNILGYKDIHNYIKKFIMNTYVVPEKIDVFVVDKKGEAIKQEILEISMCIAAVQEIFFVVYNPSKKGKKEEMMDVTYHGYTNKNQTLSSALKKRNIKQQNPIMVLAWLKRIESRMLIDGGVPKKVLIKRKDVEKKLLDIQEELYNNHSYIIFQVLNKEAQRMIEDVLRLE